jgi:hypothetical protein
MQAVKRVQIVTVPRKVFILHHLLKDVCSYVSLDFQKYIPDFWNTENSVTFQVMRLYCTENSGFSAYPTNGNSLGFPYMLE